MEKGKVLVVMICLMISFYAHSQGYSRADSLRGGLTEERIWWDLGYYHLQVEVDPENKFLSGKVTIKFKPVKEGRTLQIDLQKPLRITQILNSEGKKMLFKSDGNAHFVTLLKEPVIGETSEIQVFYEGNPTVAKNPPWDGGITWSQDSKGNPFVASSCQGIGASVWWPCKDHPLDEVDSMDISVEVPEELTNVSNGRLTRVEKNKSEGTRTFHWTVKNPINAYGVNINIGNYASWKEVFDGEKGPLDITYWVLEENEKKAKKHFEQVPMTLEAFEYWFGPYPFYEDGYQLVQTPYLGMEHQSSVTYGNGFKNGYKGYDYSGTGWGLKFDYIIVHETGHEWFANNITYQDPADMWIHEGFTMYSECLYLDYHFGKEAGIEYSHAQRMSIGNEGSIIGDYGVNDRGEDIYNKGGTILNMIRQIIDDDEKWRSILRGLNSNFYHQTVRSTDVENYISEKSGFELTKLFEQYLRTPEIPILEYFQIDNQLVFRWNATVEDFVMPLDLVVGEDVFRVTPGSEWTSIELPQNNFNIHPAYYVGLMKIR